MQTIIVIFVTHKNFNMDLHKFVESLTLAEKAKLMRILRNTNKRLTIEEWLDENDDLPVRTLNPLRFMVKYKSEGIVYMDELTVSRLKTLRNLGKVSIDLITERYPMP
jgi:hypothetical protein